MCVSGEKTQSFPPHPDTQVAHWHFPSILYIYNCKAEKHQQGALQEGSDYREGSRLSCSSLSLWLLGCKGQQIRRAWCP